MKKSKLVIPMIISAIILLASTVSIIIGSINQKKTLEDITNIVDLKKSSDVSETQTFKNKNEKFNSHNLDKIDFGEYKALYESDEVIFVSYSSEWDEAKLEKLYEEFKDNIYGDEIKNLSYIAIYDEDGGKHIYDNPPYEAKRYGVPLSFYGFLPENIYYIYNSSYNSLALTQGKSIKEVEEMAYYLSYEYGHHFAMHRLGIFGNEDDAETQYYKLRLSEFSDKVFWESDSYQEYKDNYMWSTWDLAASDYVYLMGSGGTKNIVEFYDTLEKAKLYAKDDYYSGPKELGELSRSYLYDMAICRNALPIINHAIPTPHLVEGVEELFFDNLDISMSEFTETEGIGDLGLKVNNTYSDHQFKITWEKPYEDKDVVYTLMVYDMNDKIIAAHKTVFGDEEAVADVGDFSITRRNPSFYYSTTTYSYQGWLIFGKEYRLRVTITFPDSTVIISDPIEVKFDKN